MKIPILLIVLSIGLITACKKDSTAPDSANRLQGRWMAVKSIDVEYKNDKETYRDTSSYTPNRQVYEFKADSMLYYQDGKPSGEKYTFSLAGNELIFRSGSEGIFLTLRWYQDDQMGFMTDRSRVLSSGVKLRNTSETICSRIR